MIQDITVRQEHALSDAVLSQVEQIYIDNFPENERTPFEELTMMLKGGERTLYVAERESQILAFGFVADLSNVNLKYLAYMAVKEGHHSKGVGSAFFQGMVEQLRANAPAKGLVFEMESDAIGSSNEKSIRKRRISFYVKNGGILLDVPSYKVPLFEEDGSSSSIEAVLTWCPFEAGNPIPSRNDVIEIIREIYKTEFSEFNALCDDIINKYIRVNAKK